MNTHTLAIIILFVLLAAPTVALLVCGLSACMLSSRISQCEEQREGEGHER